MSTPGRLQRPRKSRFVAIPAALVFACWLEATAAAAAADPALARACAPDVPPDSWVLEEIAREALPVVPGEMPWVLAWQIIEDDRPLRVESCLVLRRAGDSTYVLQHLYRHPDGDGAKWQLAMTHVSPPDDSDEPGRMLFRQEAFDHRPTNAEIYGALGFQQVDWSFEIDEGWRLVGGGVCEANWLEATGEKPTRRYRRAD